jgi:hypothetical protein
LPLIILVCYLSACLGLCFSASYQIVRSFHLENLAFAPILVH